MQADDDVIEGGHIGPVLLRAAPDTAKNPAAGIDDIAIDVVPLAENPGEHSLPAGDVGGGPGLREPGGNEVSDHLEPPLVPMEAVCRHPRRIYVQ